MSDLYKLRLCVEKYISIVDSQPVKETFYLPGLKFKKYNGPEIQGTYNDGNFAPLSGLEYENIQENIRTNIQGTYTGGNFIPLSGFEYNQKIIEEEFGGTTSRGTSGYGFSPNPGADYGFSPKLQSDYGFSPNPGTDYGFSPNPGITSTDSQQHSDSKKSNQQVEINFSNYGDLLIEGLYEDQQGNLQSMHLYLLNKYGNDLCIEILSGPMIEGGLFKNVLETEYRQGAGTIYGSRQMLDDIAQKIIDGYSVTNYTFSGGGTGTVEMEKIGEPDFVKNYEYGVYNYHSSNNKHNNYSLFFPAHINNVNSSHIYYNDSDSNSNSDSNSLNSRQFTPIGSSIPTISTTAPVVQQKADISEPSYDINTSSLTNEGQSIYEKRFKDVFKYLEEETKENYSFVGVTHPIGYNAQRNYRATKPKTIMEERLKNFVDQGILQLTNPKLGLVESIIKRQFVVKKVTISFFGSEENVEKTPLIQLQGVRDKDGNVIDIDPIEYEIRNLTPINAVKKVLRERIFPLVNLDFEFLDERIQENFNLLDTGVVRIGFDKKGGCWSMLGLDTFFSQEKTTINFSWLDAATIMHEFCHMLGLGHEHQNPLGKPINWDKPEVYKWAKLVHGWDEETTYINIIKKYDINAVKGIKYDPNSIMLYFFPPQLTLDKKGSRQNLQLAVEDIKFIMSLFPGKDLDYKKFYKQIYGKNIEEDSNWFSNLLKLIALLTLIYIIFRIYKKYKKPTL